MFKIISFLFIIPFTNLTQNLSFSFQLKLILSLEWPGPEVNVNFTELICLKSFHFFFIIPFTNLTQNLSFSFQLKLILSLEWPGPEGLGSLRCSRPQRLCGVPERARDGHRSRHGPHSTRSGTWSGHLWQPWSENKFQVIRLSNANYGY